MTYTARQQRLIEEVVASRASGPHRRVLETVLVPRHVTVLGTERDVVAILSAITDPATGNHDPLGCLHHRRRIRAGIRRHPRQLRSSARGLPRTSR